MTATRCRLLFVIPTLTGGGAERVVVTLLQHLDRKLFDLALAIVDTRDAAFMREVPVDVEVVDLRCLRVSRAAPPLLRLIWRLKPDVIMTTLGHLNLMLALLRPLLPRQTRCVARETTVVSHGITEYGRPWLWAAAYRWLYRRFDKVICQSHAMRDDLVSHFAIDPRRTVVIHNPLDLARIGSAVLEDLPAQFTAGAADPALRRLRLVAAGRLVRQKGFDVALQAISQARRQDLELVVLGEGPERAALEATAQRLGIAERVRFTGFCRNPYAHFAAADALLLTSQYEGFPNVALEALACGTPVVALPAPGGLREIVESVPGCVLAADMSASALADELDRWQPQRVPSTAVTPFDVGHIVGLYAQELRQA